MKIAFLFLIRDDVNFPDLWEKYFKGNENKYTIYCHAKEPNNVKSKWLKDNIIPIHVETGWGRIVNAYIALLKEAYKNKDNIKFITISESCVPLQSFNKLYNYLKSDNKKTSYVGIFKHHSEFLINTRIKTQKNVPKLDFIKHFARFCLSRYHCKQLLKSKHIDFFINMDIGDEHFLSIISKDHVKNFSITFDNWKIVWKQVDNLKRQIWDLKDNNGDIKKIEKLTLERNTLRNNPYTYHSISDQQVKEAYYTGSFFWRKMAKDCDINKNKLYMKILCNN